MIGSFPRFVDIGMSLLKREGRAAVLQCEAASLGDYPAAETTEVAVDKGACVTVCVGDGEVDGVAVIVCWAAVVEDRGCFVRVEEFCAGGEVGFGKEFLHGDFYNVGICDEITTVGEGDAERFDDGVEICGIVVVVGGEGGDLVGGFELLENPKGEQGDKALAVWRVLPDFKAGRGVGGFLTIEAEGLNRGDSLAVED